MLALMTVCVTFGSSVFSTATKQTANKFGVSQDVMVLGVSLFVLGFAFGPIIFGPLSELYGRKRPLFLGMFVFAIFQIPLAVAQNLQTIFICRFLGGLFASAPLAIVSLLHPFQLRIDPRSLEFVPCLGIRYLGRYVRAGRERHCNGHLRRGNLHRPGSWTNRRRVRNNILPGLALDGVYYSYLGVYYGWHRSSSNPRDFRGDVT